MGMRSILRSSTSFAAQMRSSSRCPCQEWSLSNDDNRQQTMNLFPIYYIHPAIDLDLQSRLVVYCKAALPELPNLQAKRSRYTYASNATTILLFLPCNLFCLSQ